MSDKQLEKTDPKESMLQPLQDSPDKKPVLPAPIVVKAEPDQGKLKALASDLKNQMEAHQKHMLESNLAIAEADKVQTSLKAILKDTDIKPLQTAFSNRLIRLNAQGNGVDWKAEFTGAIEDITALVKE